MKKIIAFLRSLRRHNDREWFAANKDRYLETKGLTDALAERLIAGVAEFEPEAASLKASDVTYRIYRDTRFSADKTPYKTHIGIYINPLGKKSPTCGYYLHIEPDNCLVAGGAWCPEPAALRQIRQDIFDNIEEYLEIIHDPGFTKYYTQIGDRLLKTAPKGFPADWEHIDLLRPRDFTAFAPLSAEDVAAPDFEARVLARMRAIQPFNRFINFTLDPRNSD